MVVVRYTLLKNRIRRHSRARAFTVFAKAVPPAPWGRVYVYRSPGERSEIDLYSFGKDGTPGGTGENVYVTNW